MKYIKTYETYENYYVGSQKSQRFPKKGDYVLLKYPESFGYSKFFDTHIGEIIKKGRSFSDYTIKFDSEKLLNNVPWAYIETFSENKEDLESIITRNKFNL